MRSNAVVCLLMTDLQKTGCHRLVYTFTKQLSGIFICGKFSIHLIGGVNTGNSFNIS